MKKELKLLNTIMKFRNEMRATKFIGALTIELLRKEFIKKGLNVSNRDVFIKGIPYELDLIVLKEGEKAQENLLYKPKQVIAVLEIKFRGIYSKEGVENIKKVFGSIKRVNKEIKCIYLTVSENTNYKYYPDEQKLGDFSFLLLERKTNLERAIERGELHITGDWDKLIKVLMKEKIKKIKILKI
ncbi:MAG: hypothetical protein IB617_02605 [Candidatus Nealsonbacteria bacterium]|nr:MAG: hypothetical protein IB617_02605 [Candidatus Nealsonbacteria bacterium]